MDYFFNFPREVPKVGVILNLKSVFPKIIKDPKLTWKFFKKFRFKIWYNYLENFKLEDKKWNGQGRFENGKW